MRSREARHLLGWIVAITAGAGGLHCVFSPEDQGASRVPLDAPVVFKLIESHSPYQPGAPVMFLTMNTEREYGCVNYAILTNISIRQHIIEVSLLGVGVPEVCLTAIGPAWSRHELHLRNGDYGLRFRRGKQVDDYSIAVSDSSVVITGEPGEISRPLAGVFWRFPVNSFAYLCGATKETSWVCDAFADSLLTTLPLVEFYFPDVGVRPYPAETQGHYFDTPARYFRYERSEDFTRAGELLRRFNQRVLESMVGVNIWLENWRGEYYRSWLFSG